MKRQDTYERTTMYAPIWTANQIGEKGKENNLRLINDEDNLLVQYISQDIISVHNREQNLTIA